MTRILEDSAEGIGRAAQMLQRGGLVAFPTETVYGLGADATDETAVARIFAAKGRPQFNPLIVHLAAFEEAEALCEVPPQAAALAQAFWPGPLTLVLPLRAGAGIAPSVTAGLPTLALRVPAHPLARALLRRTGRPLAAPSANPSGRVSPTTAAHVVSGLGGRIDAVLDGGACGVGVESTILGFEGNRPVLLRAGGLPAEALEQALGAPLLAPDKAEGVTAPGQLASHYAPKGSVRLNATAPREDETYLGFGAHGAAGGMNLSPSGDLAEAAARLFSCLHRLDRRGAKSIAVAPIPEEGLGRAINDRLRRAAAPR
ncbi:L-threonylcarbamoyladenylate synthase [Pseudoroseicyclus aestuarii]|uniref:Threonylcarbamoyl-AMP synthase n=1 Tax=Pseudoroseicyclus aestuarii TaxID=1795041 RepID=A0A318SR47_9RHOB|nr:L-threonylcarbamoyladenylate synthase [Pseudoroseicyclus aestuarii]PYE83885.1 translation factor SUA5 [Pseudoroseicyclus aestuarii]